MPQYDLYHEVVKHALIKDGWAITDDPFLIEFKGVRLYADLGAERTLAAEKRGRKIVVEIKVFRGSSLVTELEKAIGQYTIYRIFLQRVNPDRELNCIWPSLRTFIKISFNVQLSRKFSLTSK